MKVNKPLFTVLIAYVSIIATILIAAIVLNTLFGCGEIPQIQQTTTVNKTKLIRIVQVDKDGSKTISEVKKIDYKQ